MVGLDRLTPNRYGRLYATLVSDRWHSRGGLPTSSSTSSVDRGGLMIKERCLAVDLSAMIARLAAYLRVRRLLLMHCDHVKLT